MDPQIVLEQVREIIGSVLQLEERTANLQMDTTLLGGIPEFDSMAVVTVLTALEDNYGFVVNDDEISADTFATVGTVVDFVVQKTT